MALLKQLEKIVRESAQAEIMSRYNQVDFTMKQDGSFLTEADTSMQSAMINKLRADYPEYEILGEEMSAQEQQALLDTNKEGLWILDPLDGTNNFSSGVPIFSVSIALIKNKQVELGIVYDPVHDECFAAERGKGAWLNDKPLTLKTSRSEIKQCIAQIDLKRLTPELAGKIASEHVFSSQRNFGSGALDWCWIAADRSQIYVHGGQKLWDHAAGQLILKEAGGVVSNFAGETAFDLSLKPLSVVAAVSTDLHQQMMQRYFQN